DLQVHSADLPDLGRGGRRRGRRARRARRLLPPARRSGRQVVGRIGLFADPSAGRGGGGRDGGGAPGGEEAGGEVVGGADAVAGVAGHREGGWTWHRSHFFTPTALRRRRQRRTARRRSSTSQADSAC